MNQNLIIESLIVGFIALVIGITVHGLYVQVKEHDMNNMSVYAIHLFVVGVLIHLVCQYAGINKWYCTNGVACKA
jgi:uncharacterized membrane protein YiaA